MGQLKFQKNIMHFFMMVFFFLLIAYFPALKNFEDYFIYFATALFSLHFWYGAVFLIKTLGPTKNIFEFPNYTFHFLSSDKIDEIIAGGITDENLPSLNRYLAAVGEPPYKKSITKPKKEGGIMGWGGQEEESEFKQDVTINKNDSTGLQPEPVDGKVQGGGASKYSAMLTTKTEGQPAKVDGTAISLNDDIPSKKSPPGGSTDVGTELGEAVKVIVAGGEVTVDMVKAMPGLAEALVDASTRAEGATAKKLIAAAKKAEGFIKNMVRKESLTEKESRIRSGAFRAGE